MFRCFPKRKRIFPALISLLILLSAGLAACEKTPPETPKPSEEETRICSFIISDPDRAFSVDAVDLHVRYGINAAITGNRKAVFLIWRVGDEKPAVLETVTGADNEDVSFSVSDGKDAYSKETVLHPDRGFFSGETGKFFLSLCLFDSADTLCENPLVGYQHAFTYTVSGETVTLTQKTATVIRKH